MHYLFASIESFEKFLKNEYSSELQARSDDLNNIVVYAFGKVLYSFEPIFIYCSEEKNLRSNCFRLSVAQLSKFKFIAEHIETINLAAKLSKSDLTLTSNSIIFESHSDLAITIEFQDLYDGRIAVRAKDLNNRRRSSHSVVYDVKDIVVALQEVHEDLDKEI